MQLRRRLRRAFLGWLSSIIPTLTNLQTLSTVTSRSTSKCHFHFSDSFHRAYETLGNEQKRSIYDATGMSSNEQQNANFNFDGFESFSHMFKNAWKNANAEETMTNKTYE